MTSGCACPCKFHEMQEHGGMATTSLRFVPVMLRLASWLALGIGLPAPSAPPAPRPADRLQPFHYSEVTLTSGPLAAQAQAARGVFLALPNDDVLNGFRRRAGLPAPGKAMADGMT